MNLSLFIARRYLFSKKTHNAINIISGISVCGVALATMAMVCTLSVFNGFQDLVAGLFTAFDPDIKITASHDRYFHGNDSTIQKVRNLPEVETSTLSLEENAMAQYKKRQAVVTIKGVEDNFQELNRGRMPSGHWRSRWKKPLLCWKVWRMPICGNGQRMYGMSVGG